MYTNSIEHCASQQSSTSYHGISMPQDAIFFSPNEGTPLHSKPSVY